MNTADIHEVIETFADDEPIDPARLKQALAEQEGREYFVDVLVMRRFAHGRAQALHAPGPVLTRKPAPALWWSVAAGLAIVTGLAGYAGGVRITRSAIVALSEPVTAQTGQGTLAAPVPTHVIRLERGVDWAEHAGGH